MKHPTWSGGFSVCFCQDFPPVTSALIQGIEDDTGQWLTTSHLYPSGFFVSGHKGYILLKDISWGNVIQPCGWRRESWWPHRCSSNLKKSPGTRLHEILSSLYHWFPHLDTERFSSCTQRLIFAGHWVYSYAICSSYREPLQILPFMKASLFKETADMSPSNSFSWLNKQLLPPFLTSCICWLS